jgi:L-alanine-DL-glutamate epimerase-like enolase superfamily enzyme
LNAALWDLKARLLDVSLVTLLGGIRPEVPIYGSGGFLDYTLKRLREQLGGWTAEQDCTWVKMKISDDPGIAAYALAHRARPLEPQG